MEALGNLKLTCLLESCSLGTPNKDEAFVVLDKSDLPRLVGALPLSVLSSWLSFVESSLPALSFIVLEGEPKEIVGLLAVAVDVVVVAVVISVVALIDVVVAAVDPDDTSSLGLSSPGGAPKVNVFFWEVAEELSAVTEGT